MAHHLTIGQLTLLAGIALGVLLILIVSIYLIHKSGREHRAGMEFKAKTPRTENEPAFVAATVQGVIADLKSREKSLEERARTAERLLQSNAKALEAVSREISEGLIVINAEGLITLANAPARELLQVDVWSRRRFSDVFASAPAIAESIRACLESGQRAAATVEVPVVAGAETIRGADSSGAATSAMSIAVTVQPIETSGGMIQGAVCLFSKVG